MNDLQQLRKILATGEFEETGQDVDKLEEQLRLEMSKERFTRNTIVARYIEYVKGEINRCNDTLSENEDLTERQRIQLHAWKKACKEFLSHFESQRKAVEQNIKTMLNEATRQSSEYR